MEVEGDIEFAEALDGFFPGFPVFFENDNLVDVFASAGDISEAFITDPYDF